MDRKMLKQRLKDVKAMSSLVKGLEDTLMKIEPRSLKDSVKGSSPDYPYIQHVVVVEGEEDVENNPEYKRLKSDINQKRSEWLEQIREVEAMLQELDPEQQDILRRYYVNGQSLVEIGKELGYSKSAIHKKIKAYF